MSEGVQKQSRLFPISLRLGFQFTTERMAFSAPLSLSLMTTAEVDLVSVNMMYESGIDCLVCQIVNTENWHNVPEDVF